MMKSLFFAKRNFKEITRDPINLIFCIGLPLFLLVIFQQFKIPSDVYNINNFAPSIIIFSFGFISLFSGLLIAKDRTSSLLIRLFSSPMRIYDYIIGYTISLLPISIIQSALFLLISLLFKLPFTINLLYTILILIPISLLFVGLGILIGFSFTDKQAPGFSSIIIQLIAFTSGMWFDISMMSNAFKVICDLLPFKYVLDITRNVLNGNGIIFHQLLIVIIYILIIYVLSVFILKKKMTSDNK